MKMKSHLCCSVVSIFTVLYCHRVLGLQCGPQELLNGEGQCVPCLQCPAGEEPDQYCSSSNDQEAQCRACAVGTFSDSLSSWPCRAHSWCENLNRAQLSPGTSTTDAVCGDCLHGFFDTEGMSILINECLPCAMAPVGTAACEDVQDLVPKILHSTGKNTPKLVVSVATNGTIASLPEEKNTEYAVFALVPIFCIMGLLGILICNVLKKKGYHCMTEKEASDEQSSMQEKDGSGCPYIIDDGNEDTISVLVRLITEKKENAAALEELLKEYESKQNTVSKRSSIRFPPLPQLHQFKSLPHLCKHQQHLHTVHGLVAPSGPCCTRCTQKKWPEILVPTDTTKSSKVGSKNTRPGEITILSVGRFRVAHIPELKSMPLEELSPPESSDTDSIDTSHTEPAEEKSLLGGSSSSRAKSKWLKPGDSKLEDRKLIIKLGETNLII
ncbi:tumor necrosis factor receptor superfamily member 19L isoform X1 [Polypterus senegalus]|uniref:tumor necrosis factor receptor superfamily member 19L isoform X1 n=1 Tax=Polypterus senegalus TaxID=55291 RepID=UPI0019644EBE|nr:tumor necrosis factor receptor superfamily member 19L isoform X1 [Polypterus senegalus]XP_039600190.1 tumor necrosis factor receptor superfamily member 19L isoform X1 [Polypterus senegalus]